MKVKIYPIGTENENYTVTLSVDISEDSKTWIFRELGIYLEEHTEDTNKEHILFSRILFDPISLQPGGRLKLEYVIYF